MSNTSARSGGRNQRNNPYVLDELFVSFHRSPAGTAWRWRTELTTLTMTLAALWRLALLITLLWAVVALIGLVLVLAFVPVTRRFISRRFWCVLARHRLQRLCYEARLHTRSGRLPLICGPARPRSGNASTSCAAQVSAQDSKPTSATARRLLCPRRAGHRNRRWSQLVTIDDIRRDTLAASELIKSPLQRLTERYQLELVPSQDSPDEREPAA